MAAMLTSIMGNNEKVAFYINSCRKNEIEVLPPDINESHVDFSVYEGKIRFGLAAIKNVGKGAIYSIISARKEGGPFKGFIDFCQRINLSEVNKRAVESMIKAGAFDSLNLKRAQLLSVYDKVMDSIVNDKKRNIEGQMSFFTMNEEAAKSNADDFPDVKEFDKKYILAMEKEMVGLYISGHPLDEYMEELDLVTNIKISEIINIANDEEGDIEYHVEDGQRVVIGGIISSVNIKATRKNDIMAFVTLEDVVGNIEVIVFPKTYQKYIKLISEDSVVVLSGRISIREDEQPKIIAEDLKPLKKGLSVEKVGKLYIRLDDKNWMKDIDSIKGILDRYKGNSPLYIVLNNTRKKLMAPRELWVNISDELIKELGNAIGDENVKNA